MGLFSRKKKTDACIAFVGAFGAASVLGSDEHFALIYGGQVHRAIEEKCAGLPFAVWFKGSWTQRYYGKNVIRDVENNGFSAWDTGDKKQLFDEITQILILEHGVGMGKLDYSPICLYDQNVFFILCRVPVREDTLPG